MEDTKIAEESNDEQKGNEDQKKEEESLLPLAREELSVRKINTSRRSRLYLSVFILNINYLLCGVGFAWSSPVLVKLPLTDVEGSNVASMLSLGSIPSPFIAGILLNKIGRKGIVGVNASLITLSTVLLLFAGTNVTMLSIGRFFTGIFIGVNFAAVPMYIAEISENSVRGLLNTVSQVSCCGGSLMVYAIGPFVSYSVLHYVILSFCLSLLFLFPLLPNSPYYLIMKDDIEGAKKSLTWLREGTSAAFVEKELKEIQETIERNKSTKTSLSSLFTVYGNLQALVICEVLIIFQQMSGVAVIFFYSEKIIRTAGTEMSSSTCSIVIGVFMLVSAFISPLSVKYFGYKKPLMASALGMGLGMASLGAFFYLKSNNFPVDSLGWLPLLSIVVYITFFNSGFCNIPWALSGELFPSDIKPAATTIIAMTNGTTAFFLVNLFPHVVAQFSMHFLFLTCAFLCSCALMFVLLVVQDTSGMSFAEIQQMLSREGRKDKSSSGLE